MNKWMHLIRSRKFWAAVVGLLLVLVHQFFTNLPLSDAQITDIVYLLIAYILGTGLEDAGISSVSVGSLGK